MSESTSLAPGDLRAGRAVPAAVGWTALVGGTVAVAAASFLLVLSSSAWIGRTFPGFLVLANGVVASIGGPTWSGREGGLYQSAVVAVDGVPTPEREAVYDRVASRPAGTETTYRVRRGLDLADVDLQSRVFTWSDYTAIFGAYVVTGSFYLVMAIVAATVVAEARLGLALLLVGGLGGLYSLSAVGIYGPGGGGMTIHVLVEALFPASLVQLALGVSSLTEERRRAVTALAWWVSGSLAVAYLIFVDQPEVYSILHAAAETYMGLGGLLLVAILLLDGTAQELPVPSAGVRSGLTLGALLGLGLPTVLMVASGISGGAVPVNYVTLTAFLFPTLTAVGAVAERLGWPREVCP